AMSVAASLRAVCQRAGPDNDPAHAARRNQPLLPSLIPEVERKNNRNHEESVVDTHTPGTVPDAEGRLADEALNAVSLHRLQHVPRALRQDTTRPKESPVPERGDDRVLTAHRRFDRPVVEHIAPHDGES